MGRYYNSGIGKGIGTSPQTTLQNQVYENKVKEIEESTKKEKEQDNKQKSDTLYSKEDIKKLENAGVKFNKEEVVFVCETNDGKLVWLEKGNDRVGLKHIISRHKQNFKDLLNINENEIPAKIHEIITSWNQLSKTLKNIGGRDGYEYVYENNGNYIVIIVVGTNGFIVSAYPRKED